MDKIKLKELIDNKLKQVNNFLINESDLTMDDKELSHQLTLGADWDNPFKLSKALDTHSAYYARWATKLKLLKVEQEFLENKFDVWKSKKKQDIRELLIARNKKKGLTDKQSIMSITQAMVEDFFNIRFNYDNEVFVKYKKPVDDVKNKIDNVAIVVEAFKSRKDLLVAMAHLVRSMIENDLMVFNKGKLKKKESNN